MKRLIGTLTLAAVIGLAAAATSAQAQCGSETIEGTYAFRISGELFTPLGLVYRDGIALTHFDGVQSLTQVDYVLANGVTAPAPTDPNGFHTDETGSYTVNANCTGEAEVDFPTPPGGKSGAILKFIFVISEDSNQLTTIVTSLTPPNSTTAIPANIHSDARRVYSRP